MGSSICLEDRHHQNEDDVYPILFGGKYNKKRKFTDCIPYRRILF